MWLDNQKFSLIVAERGITLKALCMESGIDQSTLCRLRKGKQKPRMTTFNKIAKALNVSVAAIADFTRCNRVKSRTIIPKNKEKFRN